MSIEQRPRRVHVKRWTPFLLTVLLVCAAVVAYRRSAPPAAGDVPLPALLALVVAASVTSVLTMRLLRPLETAWAGRVVSVIVSLAPVMFALTVAVDGSPTNWDRRTIGSTVFFVLVFGLIRAFRREAP